MIDLFEEHHKVLSELKAKVKTLPIAERKKAAMLAEVFEQIIKLETEKQKAHDTAFGLYSAAVEKITTEMDLVVEGQRKIREEELQYWKTAAEPTFVLKEEDNDQKPLAGFWRDYILNSDICELSRPR